MKKLVTVSVLLILALAVVACSKKEATVEYSKGVLTETSFESKYVGVHIDFPEGYAVSTDNGAEVMLVGPEGLPNVMLKVDAPKFARVSEEQFIEELKKQLGALGMGYTFGKTSSTTVAGQKYTKLNATLKTEAGDITQDFIVRKSGDRMIYFTSTYNDATAKAKDELLAAFKGL